jgi:hypothetical protein
MVLDSLRHKAGFSDMHFDESGFLILGDRTRIEGGSTTARGLLIAAVDGHQAFELEAWCHWPDVAFAFLSEAESCQSHLTGAQIDVRQLRLDFADYAELRGRKEVKAAFDIGINVLHELGHGVLNLRDTTESAELGACEEYINRIRRELGLLERQHYIARVRSEVRPGRCTMKRAQLAFARSSTDSDRARTEWFYLSWDDGQVGSAGRSASHFKDRGQQ